MSDNLSEMSIDTASSDVAILEVKSVDEKSSINKKVDYVLLNEQIDSNSKNIFTQLDHYDKYFSNYIHGMEVNIWLERIIYIFARLFNPDLTVIFYILLFLYKYFTKGIIFFIFKPLIHVFTMLIITVVLKYIIKRPRPEINEYVKRRYNVRKKETNFSMPSGDSMQAGNFAIITLFYFNSYYGFLLVPFVMFARIFYFCHYLFDTIIGVLIGMGVSYFLAYPLKLIKI
jgi:membrane-associated phospholipid phosphatase